MTQIDVLFNTIEDHHMRLRLTCINNVYTHMCTLTISMCKYSQTLVKNFPQRWLGGLVPSATGEMSGASVPLFFFILQEVGRPVSRHPSPIHHLQGHISAGVVHAAQ